MRFLETILIVALLLPAFCKAQYLLPIDEHLSNQIIETPEIEYQTENNINSGGFKSLMVGVSFGTIAAANLSYQFRTHLISLRGATSVAIFEDNVWDVGLLYGFATQSERFHTSFSFGVAVIGGSRSDGLFSPSETIPTQFGFPLEANLYWRPLPNLGLGAYAAANINGDASFAGIGLSLQLFGRL